MMEFGWELFKERPVHGYGMNNFSQKYYLNTYSHNNYIELLVSCGIVGFALYYAMLLLPALGLLFKRKKGEKLEPLHLMLWVWLMVEMVFGVAMVQVYNKNSWLLIGVLMAESVHAAARKPELQEKNDEHLDET